MNLRANPDGMDNEVARENRKRMARAGLLGVNVLGGPGCGKTTLLEVTLRGLASKRRMGIVTADPYCRCDGNRLEKLGQGVVYVDTKARVALAPGDVRRALRELDLTSLDLLLIENVSSLIGPGNVDLGEGAKVVVYSVAAGNDKVGKYPELVRAARVVILNKTDLILLTPFNRAAFRRTVARLNPQATVLEMSTQTGEGVDRWLDWLTEQAPHAGKDGDLRGASEPRQTRC